MRRAVYKLLFFGGRAVCLQVFCLCFRGGGRGLFVYRLLFLVGGGGGHCFSTRGHLSTSCFLGWGGGSVCLGLLVFGVLEGVGGLFVYSFFVCVSEGVG